LRHEPFPKLNYGHKLDYGCAFCLFGAEPRNVRSEYGQWQNQVVRQ
jgi:hypothetical protein